MQKVDLVFYAQSAIMVISERGVTKMKQLLSLQVCRVSLTKNENKNMCRSGGITVVERVYWCVTKLSTFRRELLEVIQTPLKNNDSVNKSIKPFCFVT